MFVQIIEGHTTDADGLNRRSELWRDDLMAGAQGFLGLTSGVATDGRSMTLVRFETEAAARSNSERSEQGAWWADTEKYYDGSVSFAESTEVDLRQGGGSNDARFVQVMKFGKADRALLSQIDSILDADTSRPYMLGGYSAWTGADSCISVAYFTSEADAREGEARGRPEGFAAIASEVEKLMATAEFIDLSEPVIY